MRSTACASPYVSRWSAVIGAFQSSLFWWEVVSRKVRFEVVPPSGLQTYQSPVVFLDRWYPRFGTFNSVVPLDVIRVKSYLDSFVVPTGVPVWVFINKLYLVLKRVVADLSGVLRNGGGLGTGESYIPVMLFDPLLHRSSCFAANVDRRAACTAPLIVTMVNSALRRTPWSRAKVFYTQDTIGLNGMLALWILGKP